MENGVIAEVLDHLERKLRVLDLGLLNTDDVGLMFVHQAVELVGPGTNTISVERHNFHRGTLARQRTAF
jgi:hypothetical protein